MDERDQRTDEESVRRLLEMAGPRPAIPQEDLDAIAGAARFAWRSQVRRQAKERRGWVLAAALAAALAVVVGLAGWWKSREVPVPPARVPPTVAWVERTTTRALARDESVPLGAVIQSGDGRASLRLAGGPVVRLDVDTQLRFASAAVLELERGAVYVDTGRRSDRAIEIRTPMGTVRDVGTQFAVRLQGTALQVRVRDGSVLTEHRGRSYPTLAGEELLLHPDGTVRRRTAAAYGPAWEWTLEVSPGFDIEGRSLQEFLAWVSRETGWQVRFAEEGLADSAAQIVLHGSIGQLRADRAPFAILPSAGLAGELKDGELLVRPRR